MNVSMDEMYEQLSQKHRPQLEEIRQSITRKLWRIRNYMWSIIIFRTNTYPTCYNPCCSNVYCNSIWIQMLV